MALIGSSGFRSRLRAIQTVFRPVGKSWADETKRLAQSRVKVKTGKTRSSIRVRSVSLTKAEVEARGGAVYLEGGTRAHPMQAHRFQAMKWNASGQPLFAAKVMHPGMRKQPFMGPSKVDALGKVDMRGSLIDLWNQAD